MFHIVLSIRGRKSIGRWYRKTKPDYKISIFVNRIWKLVGEYRELFDEKKTNNELEFPELTCFMAQFLATEFHEIVHVKIHEWKIKGQPCQSKKCEKEECFWCEFTYDMEVFFVKRGVKI